MPHLERITQLWYTSRRRFEEIVRLWCDADWPSLDRRAAFGEEGKVEVTRAFAIQGEAVDALRWVGSDIVCEEVI